MRINARKAKIVFILCICVIVLGTSWIFSPQLDRKKDSLQFLELDARAAQCVPNEYITYSNEDEARAAIAFLFSSPDKRDFIYSLYINETFISGGAPIIDKKNIVDIEKVGAFGESFVLLFFNGDSNAETFVLLDEERNEIYRITLPSQPYIQILNSAFFDCTRGYELRGGGGDVLETKDCGWCMD